MKFTSIVLKEKKADTDKYIFSGSIYINFKNRQNQEHLGRSVVKHLPSA